MNWIVENYELVIAFVLGLYDLIVRLLPTVGNWSILDKIIGIIKWLFPNVRKLEGNEKIMSGIPVFDRVGRADRHY